MIARKLIFSGMMYYCCRHNNKYRLIKTGTEPFVREYDSHLASFYITRRRLFALMDNGEYNTSVVEVERGGKSKRCRSTQNASKYTADELNDSGLNCNHH